MDPQLIAYAAGFFDGEGYVGIRRRSGLKSFAVRVCVASTSLDVLLWLRETFGGSVSVHADRRDKGWKPSWQWVAGYSTADAFLRAVRPYLRIKGPQADLAIQLRALQGRRGGGRPKSDEAFAKESAIAAKILPLNRRGLG